MSKLSFTRPQISTLSKRIQGPRQVGKTTLVTQFIEDFAFPVHFAAADAVPAANITWIEQQWETARIKWQTSGDSQLLLVIDEIQS